jgi:hypothetical protein
MLKKILFTGSLIAFAIGFSDYGEASQWGLGLPLGATLLALTLIVMFLEEAVANYDAEEKQKMADLEKPAPAKPAFGRLLQAS